MSANSHTLGRFVALCVAILCCLVATRSCPAATDGGKPPLSVVWRLVENLPDNRFVAELTLRNSGHEPLSPPWSLYFNTAAKMSLDEGDLHLLLTHVNGDLYAVGATKQTEAIEPGDSRTVKLLGSPWAINVSDAPSGFYLVRRNAAGQELKPELVPREIGPFPAPAKIRRGAGDQVPVTSAASRFAENAKLTELPANELPPVVPAPVEYERLRGEVTIDAETTIAFEPPLANEARFLGESLASRMQLHLAAGSAESGKRSIRLSVGDVEIDGEKRRAGTEAYSLTIAPDRGIEIIGTDAAGVFYGIQTLRGLVPLSANRAPGKPFKLDAIRIADAPRFGYRGLHLDVARYFQSVETVKRLLEQMAFYKLNRFHWHLTDDEGWRVEIKALPELTAVGGRRGHTETESNRLIPSYGSGSAIDRESPSGSGYYSQEEFVEVLRYAKERHIVVVPEVDVPGHSRAAVKAMAARAKQLGAGERDLRLTDPADASKYESVQSWNDNVIDVGREAAYEFLDIVIGEVADMYRRADATFAIVHLGGDEVPRGAWEAAPACREIPAGKQQLTRGQQLEVHFLKRACAIVAKHGARPAAWDDCLLFAIDDQDWPVRPIAYVWNSVLGWGREDAAARLANAGFDVVLSNAPFLYFDLAYEKDPQENGYYWAGFVGNRAPFDFNPYDNLQDARSNSMGQPLATDQFAASVRLSADGRQRILGIQGQLWGENLRSAEQLNYMAFPRVIALAERAWSAEPEFVTLADGAERSAARDAAWNRFANALGQRELARLGFLAGDVGYRLPPPGAVVRRGLVHANTAFPGTAIHYTQDGSNPTTSSPRYEIPIPFDPQMRIRVLDTNGHGSRTIHAIELDRTLSGSEH